MVELLVVLLCSLVVSSAVSCEEKAVCLVCLLSPQQYVVLLIIALWFYPSPNQLFLLERCYYYYHTVERRRVRGFPLVRHFLLLRFSSSRLFPPPHYCPSSLSICYPTLWLTTRRKEPFQHYDLTSFPAQFVPQSSSYLSAGGAPGGRW